MSTPFIGEIHARRRWRSLLVNARRDQGEGLENRRCTGVAHPAARLTFARSSLRARFLPGGKLQVRPSRDVLEILKVAGKVTVQIRGGVKDIICDQFCPRTGIYDFIIIIILVIR